MSVTWNEIAFALDRETALESANAWRWLIDDPWSPLLCAKVGGIFLEKPDGGVHWLDTATALSEQVAASRIEFERMVKDSSEQVEEWFLPGLVRQLHDAGKRAGEGECYSFTILPVFAEGKFEPENMFVVPVREQFVGVADIHRQLSDLPDGASVNLKVVD